MNETAPTGRWADLGPRVLSALVLLAIGAVAVFQGGLAFQALVVLVVALMVWELLRMLNPNRSDLLIAVPLLCAIGVFVGLAVIPDQSGALYFVGVLALSAVIGFAAAERRWTGIAYGFLILAGCLTLALMRDSLGVVWLLWLVFVVIASDVAGYFAGKSLGGPKFWPAISPKKTWSGTIAGWVAAAIIGGVFSIFLGDFISLVAASVVLAFAAQMGDIAESAIKRSCDIKDSSGLIPGHGGFLDRFDGLIGAAAALFVTSVVLGWPGGIL